MVLIFYVGRSAQRNKIQKPLARKKSKNVASINIMNQTDEEIRRDGEKSKDNYEYNEDDDANTEYVRNLIGNERFSDN